MANALKTKPGINGANVLSIPKDWDPTWFRHFIHNSLKGADVRNAIAGPGISITGNISSPYATISVSGAAGGVVTQIIAGAGISVSPAGGTGIVTVTNAATTTSVVGTANEIAVSTTSGVSTLSLSPNVVIPAPSTGTTLTVNSASGASAIVLNLSAGTGGILNEATGAPTVVMNSPGVDFGTIGNTGTQTWGLGSSNSPTTMASSGSLALQWNNGGSSASTVNIGPGTFTSAGSTFQVATRATLMMNGTVDGLIDFAVNGSSQGYLYGASGEMRLNSENGNVSFYADGILAGYVTEAGGVIATSWPGFTTPTATKSTYQRGRSDSGFLDGNYPNVDSGATPGAIYSIGGNSAGTSYYPSTTSLNTMYGIGYTLGNFSGIVAMGQSAAWGMYTSSAGIGRIFLNADTGQIWSVGAMIPNGGGGNSMYFTGSGMTLGGAGGKVTAQAGGTATGGNAGDIILIY